MPFLALLIFFLQPGLSFGNISHLSSEVMNTEEELTSFKTKSSKALASQEINVSSVDLVVSSASKSKSFFYSSLESFKLQSSSEGRNYLIDLKSVLTIQIFPFHFFL